MKVNFALIPRFPIFSTFLLYIYVFTPFFISSIFIGNLGIWELKK